MSPEFPKPIIWTFHNVHPINTIAEAVRRGDLHGDYGSHDPSILEIQKPLVEALVVKTVQVVSFGRMLGESEYSEVLEPIGLQPCQNATNYLLGLSVLLHGYEIPKEFRRKNIVAAESRQRSIFSYPKSGVECFLSLYQGGTGRVLNAVTTSGYWSPSTAFVAENIRV